MTDLLTRTSVADVPPRPQPAQCGGAPAWRGSVAETLAVVAAPSPGRFEPAVAAGAILDRGDVIGHITGGGGRREPVHAPVRAIMRDLLARTGQTVARGYGLAWLQRLDDQ